VRANPNPNPNLSEVHGVVYVAAGRYNLLVELGSGLGRYDHAPTLTLTLTLTLSPIPYP